MLRFALPNSPNKVIKILCLGAHSDDIEIGCGGTILRLMEEHGPSMEVWWVVFSSEGPRKREARNSAKRFLQLASRKTFLVKAFRGSYFPFRGEAIKETFEEIKSAYSPDIIFTHYRHDLHQDHRVISDLTWNTFRDHVILEYEIPKYDGDLGAPNVFVPLEESHSREKIKHLLECFETQRSKRWFSEDTFLSLMRLRGVEANATRFAEAFYCRKMVL